MANRINLNQQLTFGAPSSPFGAETAVLLTTTQVVVLPQGVWMVKLGGVANAAAVLAYSPNLGTTWRTLATGAADASYSGPTIVYSDGFNVRISQASTASTTTTFYTQVKALF